MSILHSIILGAVQGITEFLPISSSGHLIIAQELFNIPKSFTYDVLLNIGTLLALLISFRKRLSTIFINAFKLRNYKYLTYVIIASIPTLLIGFLGSDIFKTLGTYTWLIVLMLSSVGALMIIYGNKIGHRQITKKDTLIVGLAQILALIPGTSRSGVTILAATTRGVNIKAATEFSFMLAIPTILAAIMHTLFFNGGINFIKNNPISFTIGNLTSLLLGLLAIRTLLEVLNKKGLTPFGWYRIALAFLIPVVLLIRLI